MEDKAKAKSSGYSKDAMDALGGMYSSMSKPNTSSNAILNFLQPGSGNNPNAGQPTIAQMMAQMLKQQQAKQAQPTTSPVLQEPGMQNQSGGMQ